MFQTLPCLLVLTIGFTTGTNQILDEFNYSSSTEVRKNWQELKGTLPLAMQKSNDQNVLLLSAPFASNREIPRAGMDKAVKLDLSTPGVFTVDVKPESPDSNHQVSLYFKSGPGWYSAARSVKGNNWQTLRFLKSDFRDEDKPAGWNKVDTIRLVVWRETDSEPNTHFQIRDLRAVTNEIVIIVPDPDQQQKDTNTFAAAERIEGFLQSSGIHCDRISESELSATSLGKRSVAILPFNPDLSAKACGTLNQFMEQGGKVFLNFHIPAALEKNLGIKKGSYYKPESPGSLSSIR
ncbi:MAG: hypothetical protein KDA74_23485, partial [Planctomycetaceae bacterium]|nr:hypothetical protein [Planctomycetaceae bacterium]